MSLPALAEGSAPAGMTPAAVSRPVAAKRSQRPKPTRSGQRLGNLNLFMTPAQTPDLPLLSSRLFFRDPPTRIQPNRRRPIFTMEGILLGDYYLVPNLILATDNRYDDANTRERALRDELNAQEAHRRGEVNEDPLTQLLRKRVQRLGGDPGFRVGLVIHHLLQGALQPPTKSVELVLRTEGQAYRPAPTGTPGVPGPTAALRSLGSASRNDSAVRFGSLPSTGFASSVGK